jgi:hypothetical protein
MGFLYKSYRFILCISLGISFLSCGKKSIEKINVEKENHFINSKISLFEVDQLGNIFILDEDQKLIKYDKNGIKKYEYNDQRLGTITNIDLSNPLNILLYYRDQGTIRLLDNTLSEIKTIFLYNSNKFTNVEVAAWTNDNHFWIYDKNIQKIFKVSETLNIKSETNFFFELGIPEMSSPTMIERDNKLCIGDVKNGIFIFDNFAQYLQRFGHELDIKEFIFNGKTIYSIHEDKITSKDIDYPAINEINVANMPVYKSKSIRLRNDVWYLASANGLDKY